MPARETDTIPTGAPAPVGFAPRIVPEADHPIRRNHIDREALKVLYRLRDAGFAGYLVGGGVRDIYLGKKPKDFDISTDARPGQLRKLFRNSRTIGRRFRLVQVYFRGGKIIEVSTLRSQSDVQEGKDDDRVLPSNNTFGTLEEDAFRRDLTVNSLFYEIENSTIIDYVGGVRDLENGIIRIVGDPVRRITRDPVRMMRAIRHGARNNFAIDDATWQAIIDNRDKLTLCPPSRIRDELLKDLRGGCSRAWFKLALESGLFFTLLPFYDEMMNNAHNGDVGAMISANLKVLDRLLGAGMRQRLEVDIPDHILLAFLLAPWAIVRFELMKRVPKGPDHHRLLGDVRSGLSTIIGDRFHLRRLAKEEIARLLVNLPLFRMHRRNNSWPKWLRRKSYFPDSSRFFQLYQEANGGEKVDPQLFMKKGAKKRRVLTITGGPNRSSGRHRAVQPAFSSQRRGVFGLK